MEHTKKIIFVMIVLNFVFHVKMERHVNLVKLTITYILIVQVIQNVLKIVHQDILKLIQHAKDVEITATVV